MTGKVLQTGDVEAFNTVFKIVYQTQLPTTGLVPLHMYRRSDVLMVRIKDNGDIEIVHPQALPTIITDEKLLATITTSPPSGCYLVNAKFGFVVYDVENDIAYGEYQAFRTAQTGAEVLCFSGDGRGVRMSVYYISTIPIAILNILHSIYEGTISSAAVRAIIENFEDEYGVFVTGDHKEKIASYVFSDKDGVSEGAIMEKHHYSKWAKGGDRFKNTIVDLVKSAMKGGKTIKLSAVIGDPFFVKKGDDTNADVDIDILMDKSVKSMRIENNKLVVHVYNVGYVTISELAIYLNLPTNSITLVFVEGEAPDADS